MNCLPWSFVFMRWNLKFLYILFKTSSSEAFSSWWRARDGYSCSLNHPSMRPNSFMIFYIAHLRYDATLLLCLRLIHDPSSCHFQLRFLPNSLQSFSERIFASLPFYEHEKINIMRTDRGQNQPKVSLRTPTRFHYPTGMVHRLSWPLLYFVTRQSIFPKPFSPIRLPAGILYEGKGHHFIPTKPSERPQKLVSRRGDRNELSSPQESQMRPRSSYACRMPCSL